MTPPSRMAALLAAGFLCLQSFGCAEEREPIDRVQPGAIKKTMLGGDWYFAQTVVDVPGGALKGFVTPAVVGWSSRPTRVRFDIQEKYLYVRRVDELIAGADGQDGKDDSDRASNAVIAVFAVLSHFDIQRDYNPVTGESMSVITENSTDRPWWEREHMRVDWSENLTPGYTFLGNFVPTDPVSYYVEDACTPGEEMAEDVEERCVPGDKAPFFDVIWKADGTGLERGYFDVTSAASVRPATVELYGVGDVPATWLFGNEAEEDVSTLYFTRNAFWKIDAAEHDVEPQPYVGNVTDQFGFFEVSRLAFDDETEITKDNRREYLTRFNIWEQSHDFARQCTTSADCCPEFSAYFDEAYRSLEREDGSGFNGNYTGETAKEAAERLAESRCASRCDAEVDLVEVDRLAYEKEHDCAFHVAANDLTAECAKRHYCTLSYTARRVRPVVFYANGAWPEELAASPRELGDRGDDEASHLAWQYAYADEPEETRPVLEQTADLWNAALTRAVNILKTKAAGLTIDPNVPYMDSGMRRTDPGADPRFNAIGLAEKGFGGELLGARGFDESWYDPERPPLAICRFSPVLGPDGDDGDALGVEPDVCWERIQEMSRCVFDPSAPGVNPKTGEPWVEASKWPLCSARERTPRLGDFRYNTLNWVDEYYSNVDLLGLAPGAADPLTGEILSGAAEIYLENDAAARRIVDSALLLTGDIDPADYIDGVDLTGWRDRVARIGETAEAAGAAGFGLGAIGGTARAIASNTALGQRLGAGLGGAPPSSGEPTWDGSSAPNALLDLDDLVDRAAAKYAAQPVHDDAAMLRSVAGHADGPAVESDLLSGSAGPAFLVASGLSPTSDLDDAAVRERILMTRKNPFALNEARRSVLASLTMDQAADFSDGSAEAASVSFAYEVQALRRAGRLPLDDSPTLRNGLWRLARKKLIRAVASHELGHALGLTHNFGGSQDSINYKERYWKIRTNGCADVDHDDLAPALTDPGSEPGWDEEGACGGGYGEVGPRFVRYAKGEPSSGDPLSRFEVYNKIDNFAYASVMDYPGNYLLDEDGPSRYDFAAILYGYGQHFEVYKKHPQHPWRAHDSLIPVVATEDSPDSATVIDTAGEFSGVAPGALFVNLMTGEESTVKSFSPAGGSGATGGTFALDTPFASRPAKGDKLAVFGPQKIRFNDEIIDLETLLNGYPQFWTDYLLGLYQKTDGQILAPSDFVFFVPHYTGWPANWSEEAGELSLGFNEQENRGVRDVREFDWRVFSESYSQLPPGFSLVDQSGDDALRVPYVYCGDEQVDLTGNCRARDVGADDYERMQHIVSEWNDWYIARSFVRDRVGVVPADYPAEFYDRIYRAPKAFNDVFALYTELLQPKYDERTAAVMFLDPWNSWGGYTMAVHDGFNMLLSTLTAPDVDVALTFGDEHRLEDGSWAVVSNPYTRQGSASGNAAFDISEGARIFETNYADFFQDDSCGRDFMRCVWNVGWYYDKIMALNALSESSTRFVARDTAADIRQFRVSFFDNFNWQIKRYFSAMMGESWRDFAPVTVTRRIVGTESASSADVYPLRRSEGVLPVSGDENPFFADLVQPLLFFRDFANPVADVTNPPVYRRLLAGIPGGEAVADRLDAASDVMWTPVDPNFGFTTQVYAMLLGMARFQHNYDFSFYNTARMWTQAGSAPTAPGEEYASYYDQENAIVYYAIARYQPDDVLHPFEVQDGEAIGVAAAMLRLGNLLCGRGHGCDPITGPGAHFTETTLDDCCDDPYAEGYPATPSAADDCAPEFGDPERDFPSPRLDPDGFARAMSRARLMVEHRKTRADEALKRYRGLLDFQVRLTNVYDTYLGFVGDPYAPGNAPSEGGEQGR